MLFKIEFSSFKEGTSPEFTIKFAREILEITSWTRRLYYNCFSNLLGAGINVHLKENEFLRSVFNLDTVKVEENQQLKVNRFERVCLYKLISFILKTSVIFLFLLFDSKWQIRQHLNCVHKR